MKVQYENSSSKKTRALIKKTFAELVKEKKEFSKITVTELVKRADITRTTFYTHYEDIYEVAEDYELETIELLISDDLILHNDNDIYHYFEDIIACLKKNEEIYKMLLSSNEYLFFLLKIEKMATQKIYDELKNTHPSHPYLELDVSFLMDGIIGELVKYFRNKSDYTLDDLLINMKKWFKKLFEN